MPILMKTTVNTTDNAMTLTFLLMSVSQTAYDFGLGHFLHAKLSISSIGNLARAVLQKCKIVKGKWKVMGTSSSHCKVINHSPTWSELFHRATTNHQVQFSKRVNPECALFMFQTWCLKTLHWDWNSSNRVLFLLCSNIRLEKCFGMGIGRSYGKLLPRRVVTLNVLSVIIVDLWPYIFYSRRAPSSLFRRDIQLWSNDY